MAHALETFADGTSAFFTNREVAWHKLGTVTDGAQTAADALRLAQLDWNVYKSDSPVQVPVIRTDGSGVDMIKDESKFMTYRDHPKLGLQSLGVVGKQYTVIQNSEAFDFLNALVDEGGAVFETAGSLDDGRRVFMSMKMPNTVEIAGGQDVVDLYLMATTSHNGTKAFTAAITPIRPVCSNTVKMALSAAKSTWYLKHTMKVNGKIQQAREALGIVFKYEEAFQSAVDDLAAAKFTKQEFAKFVDVLLPKATASSALQDGRREEAANEMLALWSAPTQANVVGTRWAAYNTVVEWADWVKPVRAGKKDETLLRAKHNMLGTNDGLKQRAYALLSK